MKHKQWVRNRTRDRKGESFPEQVPAGLETELFPADKAGVGIWSGETVEQIYREMKQCVLLRECRSLSTPGVHETRERAGHQGRQDPAHKGLLIKGAITGSQKSRGARDVFQIWKAHQISFGATCSPSTALTTHTRYLRIFAKANGSQTLKMHGSKEIT